MPSNNIGSKTRQTSLPGRSPAQETARPPWFAEAVLEPLYTVNEQCLALLTALAAAPAPPPAAFGLIESLRADFGALDPLARRRAARIPFLLVELQFRSPEWWRQFKSAPEKAAPESRPRPLPRTRFIALTRSALTVAWHIARTERDTAALTVGLAPAVAPLIASLSPAELSHLAERQHRFLAPRWAERPALWRQLLAAARSGEEVALRAFRIQALQVIGAEILSERA